MPSPDWSSVVVAVKAMNHPLRLAILAAVEESGGSTPRLLARQLDAQLENLSYHVRTLRDGGMLRLTRRRMVKGAVEHRYVVTDRGRAVLALARMIAQDAVAA